MRAVMAFHGATLVLLASGSDYTRPRPRDAPASFISHNLNNKGVLQRFYPSIEPPECNVYSYNPEHETAAGVWVTQARFAAQHEEASLDMMGTFTGPSA